MWLWPLLFARSWNWISPALVALEAVASAAIASVFLCKSSATSITRFQSEWKLHSWLPSYKLFSPPLRKRSWTHGVWKSKKKYPFNIASEASYVYFLSVQKFVKNAKNGPFWQVFDNLKLAVKHWPDRSLLIGQKLVEIEKLQMRHFEWFSNTVKTV